MPIDARGFLEDLESLLEQVGSSTPLRFTDPPGRWRVLSGLLLGHPQVRGGSRPRDYPMGRFRRRASGLALELSSVGLRSRTLGAPGAYTLHEFIAVLQAVATATPDAEPDGLIVACLHEIFRGLRLDGPALASGVIQACALLGMSSAEAMRPGPDESGRFQPDGELRDQALHARVADSCCRRIRKLIRFQGEAFLSAAPEEQQRRLLEGLAPHAPRKIEALTRRRFRVLRLKARKVQDFLARSTSSQVLRGASAWCSQATARWRTALLRDHPDFALAGDSDAVVTLLAPQALPLESLRRSIVPPTSLDDAYPSLIPVFRQAGGEGLPLDAIDPPLEARIEETDLWRHSVGAARFDVGRTHPSAGLEILPIRRPVLSDAKPCSGIEGEPAFKTPAFWTPRWYRGTAPGRFGPWPDRPTTGSPDGASGRNPPIVAGGPPPRGPHSASGSWPATERCA